MPFTLRFSLSIDAEEWLRVYRGTAHRVRVRAHDGRVMDFSARHLQPHVRHDGVHGRFEMDLDENHRMLALRRISD